MRPSGVLDNHGVWCARQPPNVAFAGETNVPTYDYRCQECNHEFRVIESISTHEAAKPRCSECESSKVERVFTAINVKTSKKS